MTTLLLIILFCLAGGVLSVLAAGAFLLAPEHWRDRILPHLVSFAVGALLGAAFLALLPHALMDPAISDVHHIGYTVLLGLLGFFVLEKTILWRHCHSFECEAHTPEHMPQDAPVAGNLILLGDALHNFVDGVLIAAAFMIDTHLGIVTAIAVVMHEIPQEVGDFAVLLSSGFSRKKALIYNMVSSMTTVIGGVLAYFVFSGVSHVVPYILAIAAASFIYIAVADLIPGLHKRLQPMATFQQLLLIVAGVGVIHFAHSTLH